MRMYTMSVRTRPPRRRAQCDAALRAQHIHEHIGAKETDTHFTNDTQLAARAVPTIGDR